MANTEQRVEEYVKKWADMGYPEGIPDEVPHELAKLNLAPSYKAIAMCILNNDLYLSELGFGRPVSVYYGILKRIELGCQ